MLCRGPLAQTLGTTGVAWRAARAEVRDVWPVFVAMILSPGTKPAQCYHDVAPRVPARRAK